MLFSSIIILLVYIASGTFNKPLIKLKIISGIREFTTELLLDSYIWTAIVSALRSAHIAVQSSTDAAHPL